MSIIWHEKIMVRPSKNYDNHILTWTKNSENELDKKMEFVFLFLFNAFIICAFVNAFLTKWLSLWWTAWADSSFQEKGQAYNIVVNY